MSPSGYVLIGRVIASCCCCCGGGGGEEIVVVVGGTIFVRLLEMGGEKERGEDEQ